MLTKASNLLTAIKNDATVLTPLQRRTNAIRYLAKIGARVRGIGTLDLSDVSMEYEEDEIAQEAVTYLMSDWSFSVEN